MYMYTVFGAPDTNLNNKEVASLERLKVNGVDSLGLGQVASIDRVASL